MLKPVIGAILLTSAFFSDSAIADQKFGEGADQSKLVSISTILNMPEKFQNQTVTIQGKIDKVCKKKGCWMTLKADADTPAFRVKVKDGVMVFPVAAIGKTAYATGKVQAIKMSIEQTQKHLAHYAEEQQETFDPNSVKTGMTLYQLVPTGVSIKD